MADWAEEFVNMALSARARRGGAAYAGPGSGGDVPKSEHPPIAFTGGLPDPALLPTEALTAHLAAVLAGDTDGPLQYGGSQGAADLREWLAEHWSPLDGTPLTAAHFMIANGSAGALENLCETFLDPGDVAVVEAPSFPGSVRTIRSLTSRIESVPVGHRGLDVDVLEQRVDSLARAGERVRLLYTIPTFQNPTGATLTTERRKRVLDLCRRHDVLVIEDDAYGELAFDGTPPQSMFGLAAGEGVIKIGTFSKIVAPGLRVGWCQAQPKLIDALVATRTDMGTTPLLIHALARFARSGELEPHIRDLRTAYARKCRVMLDALDAHCRGLASWQPPSGGFFVWLTLAEGVSPAALVAAARDEGVTYVGGQVFLGEQVAGDGPRVRWGPGESPFLRLAYSYVAESQIAEGVARLGKALSRAASG